MTSNVVALLSLDEIDRVKKINGIRTTRGLAEASGVSRNTWTTAIRDRRPTDAVIQGLMRIGANPAKILVAAEEAVRTPAA